VSGDQQSTAGTDRGMLESANWRFRPGRGRSLGWWLLTGERPEPRPGCIGLYEQPDPSGDDIGICCSGGGIRSAAFNLGALQTLQSPAHRVLQQSKYLAAVSGGSYIAAAFSMVAKTWSRTHDAGRRPAKGQRGHDDSDPRLVTDDSLPFHAGSEEEQYLRNHLSYLAPNGTARLHLALRMLVGMLVNVLVIGLPFLLIGLVIGWYGRVHYGDLKNCTLVKQTCDHAAHVPGGVWIAIGLLTAGSLGCVVLGLGRPRRDFWRAVFETWEVRLFLAAGVVTLLLVVVPWLAAWALDLGGVSNSGAAAGSGGAAFTSIAALFAAALGHVRGRLRDEKKAVEAATKRFGEQAKRIREVLIAIVVILAGPAMLLAIGVLGVLVAVITGPARGTETIDVWVLGRVTWAFAIWLCGAAVLLGWLWWRFNLTSVSLHPFYRRRLATAFGLKRVWLDENGEEREVPTDPEERATGRVVARQRKYDEIVKLSDSGVEPGCCAIKSWPLLVVCAAANVSDPGVTPPGRAVTSFTFSPTAIGGPVTAAAPTTLYEGDLKREVTLPAAVAMSGAAIAPSMGKLTYRPTTFLLGLANIRLGVWVPNPAFINKRHPLERGDVGASAVAGNARAVGEPPASPRPSGRTPSLVRRIGRPRPQYLWKEVIGRNRLEDKFLYVTDGGHYENLGLVELLRRGCRTIYCFDAGGGSSGGGLWDAIAIARTELNVDIEIEDAPAVSEDPLTRRSRRCCLRGRIIYPARGETQRVEGTLFYARSVVDEHAPWELQGFQATDPVFPHHSTFDQFFDDQKFEAYRLLGAHAAQQALGLSRLHRRTVSEPLAAVTRANGSAHRNGNTNGSFTPPRRDESQPIDEYAMDVIRKSPGITVGQLAPAVKGEDVFRIVGRLERKRSISPRTQSGRAGELWPA
jgi:hypothetical protein